MAYDDSFDPSLLAEEIKRAISSGLEQGLGFSQTLHEYIMEAKEQQKQSTASNKSLEKAVKQMSDTHRQFSDLLKNLDGATSNLAKAVNSLLSTPANSKKQTGGNKGYSPDVLKGVHGILSFSASSNRTLNRMEEHLQSISAAVQELVKSKTALSVGGAPQAGANVALINYYKRNAEAQAALDEKKRDILLGAGTATQKADNIEAHKKYFFTEGFRSDIKYPGGKDGSVAATPVVVTAFEGSAVAFFAAVFAKQMSIFKRSEADTHKSKETGEEGGTLKEAESFIGKLIKGGVFAAAILALLASGKIPTLHGTSVAALKILNESGKKLFTSAMPWMKAGVEGVKSKLSGGLPTLSRWASKMPGASKLASGAGALADFGGKALGKVASVMPAGLKSMAAGLPAFLGKIVKFIPGIGTLISLWSMMKRFGAGDFVGGLIDLASGVAALVPGLGTGISIALSLANAGRDIAYGGPKGAASGGINQSISALIGSFLEKTTFGQSIMNLADGLNLIMSGEVWGGIKKLSKGVFGFLFSPIGLLLDFFQVEDKETGGKKGLGATIVDVVSDLSDKVVKWIKKKLSFGWFDDDESASVKPVDNEKLTEMSRLANSEKDPVKKEQLRQEFLKAKYGDNVPSNFANVTRVTAKANDFIKYGSTVTPIDSQDQLIGGKTGGPVEKALNAIATAVASNRADFSQLVGALKQQNAMLINEMKNMSRGGNGAVISAPASVPQGNFNSLRDPAYEHRITVYNRLTRDLINT